MYRQKTSCYVLLAFLLLLPGTSAQSQELSASAGAAQSPSQLDQEYERYFIVHYDMTLLLLTDTLLKHSLSDAMIHRALTACGMVAMESQIDFSSRFIGAKGKSFGNRLISFVSLQDMPPGTNLSLQDMPPGPNLCLLGFRCSKEVAPKVRAKIWTAVVAELEKFWQKTQDAAFAARHKRQSRTHNGLVAQISESEARLDNVMNKYIQLQVATLTTSDSLRKELQSTIASRWAITLNITSLEARREATQKRIDSLRKQHGSQIERSEICQQLAQIVSIREEALARTVARHRNATGTAVEVGTARAALARAKVELLRAQIEQPSSGARELVSLNESLGQMGIDLAEKKATLEATLKQVDQLGHELAKQLHAEKDLDRTKQQIDLLQSQIRTLEQRWAELDSLDQSVQLVSITPWGE
jgi:hypothetical protein